MPRLLLLIVLTHLFSSCQGNQRKITKKHLYALTNNDTVPKEAFTLLEFMVDEKPCAAMINLKYKSFDKKKDFPLSVFISVNTIEKNKDGHPTAKEAVEFNRLENEILKNTEFLSLCYIGHTTMNGYRDVIFYIKPADQEKFNSIINEIKKQNLRIKSYVFENDPKWEAVSEFYEALK